MPELSTEQQQAISRLIRKWITSETLRRYIFQLLKLPADPDLSEEQRSKLDELDRKHNVSFHGTKVRTEEGPEGVVSGRPTHRQTSRARRSPSRLPGRHLRD